jgi:hypothetical protein
VATHDKPITATRLEATLGDFLAWFFFVAVVGTFPLLAALVWNAVTTHTFGLGIFTEGELLAPAYAICGTAIAQWFAKDNLGFWGRGIRFLYLGSNVILMVTILMFIWVISLHSLGSLSYGSNPDDVVQGIAVWSAWLFGITAALGGVGQISYALVSK